MTDKILERIERVSGVHGLVSILAERLSPTDLQSVLLAVYRLRARRLRPSDVLSDYLSNRFVRPAPVSARALVEWEHVAFSLLPGEFESVVLSPVCPLGANSVVAPIDQDWAVSTVRNTEVVSDCTNVLALECAVRRRALLRADPRLSMPVHLAASHRLLRGQHYADPNLAAHFSIFALCSAGRDRGNLHFELSALGLQIRFYLTAVRAFLGPAIPLHVSLTDLAARPRTGLVETLLFSPLLSEFQYLDCAWNPARQTAYYQDLCFKIHVTAPSGQRMELADGGCVNWTRQLLSDAKERLLISGIGSERVCGLRDSQSGG